MQYVQSVFNTVTFNAFKKREMHDNDEKIDSSWKDRGTDTDFIRPSLPTTPNMTRITTPTTPSAPSTQVTFACNRTIKTSPVHRFGVFAAKDMKKGRLVEQCLVLTLPEDATTGNILEDYTFHTDNEEEVCLLLCGGSVYNHADKPNVGVFDSELPDVQEIWTLRNVKKGEELFISYGKAYWGYHTRKRGADDTNDTNDTTNEANETVVPPKKRAKSSSGTDQIE